MLGQNEDERLSHRSIDRFHPELGRNWMVHRFDQFWSIAFHSRHSQEPFMAPVPARAWQALVDPGGKALRL